MSDTANQVTPVPAEVNEAVNDEMREPWMDILDEFIQTLENVSQPHVANTAAEVREAFLRFQKSKGPCLEKRDVALKLAAQGFQEACVAYHDVLGHKRSTKRVYSLVFPGGSRGLVKAK